MSNVNNWTEGILISLVFVSVFGLGIAGFNTLYGQTNSVGLTDNTTETAFITYQNTSQNQINTGEVAFDATQGITLKSSYGIVTDAIRIIWSFITGGWIEKVFEMSGLGQPGTSLGFTLRVLFFLSLVFAILYAVFKVRI